MKKLAPLFILIICSFAVIAQENPPITKTAFSIEMLFPEGKSKALILSYDDGQVYDTRLVQLMNKYKLIGSFYLNSNLLGTEDCLKKEAIKTLFKGHEVGIHTANHPNLIVLSKTAILREIAEDQIELERLTGNSICGMAYPFGNYNDTIIDAVKGLGLEYARTIDSRYDFKIPENVLKWNPTIHQFANAYSEPNTPENDKKELTLFYQIINNFLETKEVALCNIWGHSWEIGEDPCKWDETEHFFKMISNNSAILYSKQIDMAAYVGAFRNLKLSVDKNTITNQSSIPIFIRVNGKNYQIAADSSVIIL